MNQWLKRALIVLPWWTFLPLAVWILVVEARHLRRKDGYEPEPSS